MPLFQIKYEDPDTQEICTVEKVFKDSEGGGDIIAAEWAEDYAYMMADKGWYEITLIED